VPPDTATAWAQRRTRRHEHAPGSRLPGFDEDDALTMTPISPHCRGHQQRRGGGAAAQHGCNETLCVRVHPDHAHAGTQTANLRYAVSLGRHRGSRPGNIDPRGRHHRALAIRAALADGYDPIRLSHARENALLATVPLFDLTVTG